MKGSKNKCARIPQYKTKDEVSQSKVYNNYCERSEPYLNPKKIKDFFNVDILRTNNVLSIRVYKGPEIPCLRIIKKCINMKTANDHGNTKV